MTEPVTYQISPEIARLVEERAKAEMLSASTYVERALARAVGRPDLVEGEVLVHAPGSLEGATVRRDPDQSDESYARSQAIVGKLVKKSGFD